MPHLLVLAFALACAAWVVFIFFVQLMGVSQLFRFHTSTPPKPVSPSLPKDVLPHITVIRPVKGLEPALFDCLASSFRQTYPRDKMTICMCVESTDDPAYPVLQQVLSSFPSFDAKILIEREDPLLHAGDGHVHNLGPNPKIRNISRAYREAGADDLIWVVDCNVWISKDVAGRMVDKLVGFRPAGVRATPYKLVHQLPLAVAIDAPGTSESATLLPQHGLGGTKATSQSSVRTSNFGGRLDEMFHATSHAKFYSAINTVGVAPCLLGKSNMFRKSHLDLLTDPARNPRMAQRSGNVYSPGAGATLPCDVRSGIDYFSTYICEDHLIGDLLWKSHIEDGGGPYRNHALALGDLAVQPLTDMPVRAYAARRARWLRVRKYTVLAATLVEPGTESFLCCFYLAFAVTTLPAVAARLAIPQTWSALAAVWALGVTAWMLVDCFVHGLLLRMRCIDVDEDTPRFARGTAQPGGIPPRPFLAWLPAWLVREALALPIWTWAVLCGTTVAWRGRSFRVRVDMSTVAIGDEEERVLSMRRSADAVKLSHPVPHYFHAHNNSQPNGNGVTARRSSSKDRID